RPGRRRGTGPARRPARRRLQLLPAHPGRLEAVVAPRLPGARRERGRGRRGLPRLTGPRTGRSPSRARDVAGITTARPMRPPTREPPPSPGKTPGETSWHRPGTAPRRTGRAGVRG